MKAHASALELNASKGRKNCILLSQPELFVRSAKAALGDVLADPGTTMRAIATEMVVPTVTQHYRC